MRVDLCEALVGCSKIGFSDQGRCPAPAPALQAGAATLRESEVYPQAMRVLLISSLYPPHHIGGYELGCRDVAEGLKARGHQVKVLTSTYGVGKPECEGDVYRWLEWDGLDAYRSRLVKFARMLGKETKNRSALRRMLKTYQPDVLYVWNLAGLSISMVLLAQSQRVPSCYFVSDDWLSRWEGDRSFRFWQGGAEQGRIARLSKAALRSIFGLLDAVPSGSLDLRHVQFASEYLKRVALRAGKPVDDAEVIHWGVDAVKYPFKKESKGSKRLLYVGQLAPEKGVHTTIEAMRILVREHECSSLKLTIAGSAAVRPDYGRELQDLVRRHSLSDNVSFAGYVSHEHLPAVFHEHDILLFPSVWDEPFSIALLEGLSCGLAVIATATGGTPEILRHEVNALLFPKEDAAACAGQILRLLNEEASFERIRKNGRCTVEEEFRLESMIDRIEHSLIRTSR